MTVMKVRYKKLGGHYHCTIFTAPAPNLTYANCGDVVFDEREWPDILQVLLRDAMFEEKV